MKADGAAIVLNNLHFSYGHMPVLREINLDIRHGEMFAVLGPNGSGKTTLLRVISGFLKPSMGDVVIESRSIRAYSRKNLARILGVLPQEQNVLPTWRVREFVSLGRIPYKSRLEFAFRDEDVQAVDRALEMMQIEDIQHRRISSLSEGQKQRVMIAMLLAQEVKIMLLDEPTAHLDMKYKNLVFDALYDIRKSLDITVVACLHDPIIAALYFDRVALLKDGKVYALGSPDDTLNPSILSGVYDTRIKVVQDEEIGVPLAYAVPISRSARDNVNEEAWKG